MLNSVVGAIYCATGAMLWMPNRTTPFIPYQIYSEQ
jgi:hypothetical protein